MASDIIWGLTWGTCCQNMCKKSTRNHTMSKKVQILREKMGKMSNWRTEKLKSLFYAGDLVTCMGEREVNAVFGRVAIYVPCEWNLDSRCHALGGFSISRAEFWIPKLSIPDSARKTVLDSGFCEQKFPVIQIQITLHGASPSLNIERRYI